MTLHQAAQKAVEALKSCVSAWHEEDRVKAWELGRAAIAALESALQEVPREPTDEAIAAKWNELCGSKAATSWNDKVRAVIQHFSASPSTTQQPSVDHALNTTPVVDHATQQQEAGSREVVAYHDKDQPNGIAWCPGYPEKLPDITPLYAGELTSKRLRAKAAAPSTPAREEAGVPAVDSQTNPPADADGGTPQ